MPLTAKVTFEAVLEKGKRLQIPKLIRWRFKMENGQALKVGVNFLGIHKSWQFFYTKMRKDGRITVPKLVLIVFGDEETRLAGHPLEVTLEPA